MKKFIHVAALACCLSLFLFTGSALAQHRGGGGGGGHAGGGAVHGGGYHGGGYGGGYHGGGYAGGYHGGGYYGGYHGGGYYGYRGGVGVYLGGYPYPYYAPNYGYNYGPDYYYAPPVATYNTYSPTIVTQQPYAVPTAPAAPPETSDRARLLVLLPDANARVFIEDTLTRQTGTARDFVTPPLAPDKTYGYTIRATWMENGREVSRSMDVKVQAGRDTTVDFRPPPNSQP